MAYCVVTVRNGGGYKGTGTKFPDKFLSKNPPNSICAACGNVFRVLELKQQA
jgi:hypothetical protein